MVKGFANLIFSGLTVAQEVVDTFLDYKADSSHGVV